MRKLFTIWSFTALSSLLVGCAAPTRMASNVAENVPVNPSRVFVITDIGSDFGDEFWQGFQGSFVASGRSCGAEVQISRLQPLELDDASHLKRATAFGPDVIISIRRVGGVRDQGVLINATYDLRMLTPANNKMVWRAQTSFARGFLVAMNDRGKTFGGDVFEKLKSDKVFTRCAAKG